MWFRAAGNVGGTGLSKTRSRLIGVPSSRGTLFWAGVFVLNLLVGWTVIIWFICLVWSFTGNTERRDIERAMEIERAIEIAQANREQQGSHVLFPNGSPASQA